MLNYMYSISGIFALVVIASFANWSLKDFFEVLAAVGTFLTFVMLFRKDKDKQDQINKLADVALKIKDQNLIFSKKHRLDIRPTLEFNIQYPPDGFNIEVKNYSIAGDIVGIMNISENVRFGMQASIFPLTIRPNEPKYLNFNYVNREILSFSLDLRIKDIDQNEYIYHLKQDNHRIRFLIEETNPL
ncbi:MAG: hypothetical protein EOO43_00565 [Flavobacterium sp.]|nr:MAG: hypothetical protein EOO43_00565 [Flavobacterium sp.]